MLQALGPAPLTRRPRGGGWGEVGGVTRSWAVLRVLTVTAGGSVVCLSMTAAGVENHGPVRDFGGGSQRLFQVKSSAGHEARLVSLKVPLQLIPGAALGVNLRLLPPDCVSLILGYFVSKRENAPFGWLGQLNEGLTHTGWRKWKLFLVTITRNEYSETSRGNYTNNNVK